MSPPLAAVATSHDAKSAQDGGGKRAEEGSPSPLFASEAATGEAVAPFSSQGAASPSRVRTRLAKALEESASPSCQQRDE